MNLGRLYRISNHGDRRQHHTLGYSSSVPVVTVANSRARPAPRASPRLRLREVRCTVGPSRAAASVWMEDPRGIEHVGTASSERTAEARASAVAQAAINAVQEFARFVHTEFGVSLEDVVTAAGTTGPVVVVTMALNRGGRGVLTGAVSIGADVDYAVARAVLHGLNRHLEPLLRSARDR